MTGSFALLPVATRVFVAVGYVVFFALILFKKRPAGEKKAKSDPTSRVGIALQMLAFALVWLLQRPLPRAGEPLSTAEVVLDVAAPILTIVSAWIGLSAVRTLGRQWSYEARLIESHQLIVEGPYRWVRHPIYTAMLGKVIATNFAFGHWLGLLVAVPVFMIGTMIRTRSEESLLRGQFGAQYEDYARRVRGMIPWVV
jgi:protein-S-isoprenylcysteine O-methyltransferase Ste14